MLIRLSDLAIRKVTGSSWDFCSAGSPVHSSRRKEPALLPTSSLGQPSQSLPCGARGRIGSGLALVTGHASRQIKLEVIRVSALLANGDLSVPRTTSGVWPAEKSSLSWAGISGLWHPEMSSGPASAFRWLSRYWSQYPAASAARTVQKHAQPPNAKSPMRLATRVIRDTARGGTLSLPDANCARRHAQAVRTTVKTIQPGIYHTKSKRL